MFLPDIADEAQVVSANNLVRQQNDEQGETTAHTPIFLQFPLLSEDLQIFVLSFVAEVPFEDPNKRSPVTHILPYVTKSFHRMCQSNYFWQMALERLVQKEPFLWKNGLLKLSPVVEDVDSLDFVRRVHEALDEPGYLRMFRMIVEQYLRLTGPVFIMSGVARLGEPIGLHFFEPRYRLLIRQVMEDFPEEARQGGPIAPQRGSFPTFIYAHMVPFDLGSPACLVEVHRCTINQSGTADVMIVPKSYVRMERLWELPNSGRLHVAQCLRMGLDDSNQVQARNPQQGFENPLIQWLLQNEEIGGGGAGEMQGPLRAMLAYLVNDHGNLDDDDESDEGGMQQAAGRVVD